MRGDELLRLAGALGEDAIFASLSVVFFVITFFSVKERVQPPAGQKADIKQDFRDVLRNGPWLAMFGMTLFVFITLALRGNASYVHVTYYMDPEAMRSFLERVGLFATPAALEDPGLGGALAGRVQGEPNGEGKAHAERSLSDSVATVLVSVADENPTVDA